MLGWRAVSLLAPVGRGCGVRSVCVPTRYYSNNSMDQIDESVVGWQKEGHGVVAPRHHRFGRSSKSGIVATVFGATGNLGRYVVSALGKIGSQVIVPYRGVETKFNHLKTMGDIGQIVAVPIDTRQPESLVHAMRESNVVINLIGRDTSTRNYSLREVHVDTARLLAGLARELGVPNFVHVSALSALPDSRSEWNQTKYDGEVAVREENPDAVVLRAGTIFGPYDRFTVPIARMLRYWPVYPLLNPTREVQPIYGPDLAQIIMATITSFDIKGKTFDIGGPVVYEYGTIANIIAEMLELNVRCAELPQEVGSLLALPFSFYREPPLTPDGVIKLFDHPDVVREGANTMMDLGVNPKSLYSLENIGYKYLQMFQEPKNRYIV